MKDNMKYPKEKMRLNIELADNGIIIRNQDIKDEVRLAVSNEMHTTGRYGVDIDHSEEYREIGNIIYGWLINCVIPEHDTELVITNFDLDITATCKGREML